MILSKAEVQFTSGTCHQLTFKPVKYGIEVAEKSNQQRLHGSVAQT